MKTKYNFTYDPNLPDTLDEIIGKIYANEVKSDELAAYCKLVLMSRQKLQENSIFDDLYIRKLIDIRQNEGKDAYLQSHFDYMGLTLLHHEMNQINVAWYYYCKAQRLLGIYQSWDVVLCNLREADEARQNRAKGGKVKSEKHLKILYDALLKVITEQKPVKGWESKKQLIAVALPNIEKIVLEKGGDGFPLFDNLDSAIYRWLRGYNEISRAYANNCSQNCVDSTESNGLDFHMDT